MRHWRQLCSLEIGSDKIKEACVEACAALIRSPNDDEEIMMATRSLTPDFAPGQLAVGCVAANLYRTEDNTGNRRFHPGFI